MDNLVAWVNEHKAVALGVGGGLVAFLAYAWIRNRHASAAASGAAGTPQLLMPQLYPTAGSADGSAGGGGGGLTPPPATTTDGGTIPSTGSVTGSGGATSPPPIAPAPTEVPTATAPNLVITPPPPVSAPVAQNAPAPPPPPPMSSPERLPDNWQQIASVPPAPSGYAATPIVSNGSIVGENLWTIDELSRPSAPWQQQAGLAPAPVGYVAQPITDSSGAVFGERFTRNPAETPAVVKDYFYYQAHPEEVRQSIYGPVSAAQWEMLPQAARL